MLHGHGQQRELVNFQQMCAEYLHMEDRVAGFYGEHKTKYDTDIPPMQDFELGRKCSFHYTTISLFPSYYILKIFFLIVFVYFERERPTECEWKRGRERGRQRIWSRLQVLSCQHRARCGARTHER